MAGINVIRRFLRLKDVDDAAIAPGFIVVANAGADGVEFVDPETVGGAGNLVDLGDVTGTPSAGTAPVSNGSGSFPFTDIATQAELDAEASTRAAADTALDGRVDALEAADVIQHGSGSPLAPSIDPTGNDTAPRFIGDLYIDDVLGALFLATGTDSDSWVLVSGPQAFGGAGGVQTGTDGLSVYVMGRTRTVLTDVLSDVSPDFFNAVEWISTGTHGQQTLVIRLGNAGQYEWTFNADGTITFPTGRGISGDAIYTGTVADARIASTIARDSEVTAAVSAEATARDAAIAAALAAADGAGLSDNGSGVLAVNVDDSTIEISADTLRVKDAGITSAKLGIGTPSNDDIIQRKAGAWTSRTIAQLLADLAVPGTTFQPLDSDLSAIAALSTTLFGRSLLALADAAALRTAAGLVIGTDVQAYDPELAATLGINQNTLLPTGAIAQSMPRNTAMISASGLASGTVQMQGIYLRAGQVVTSITWITGASGLSSPTNQYFGLYDSSRALLANSANDSSTPWGANTAKTLNLTSPYTVTTSGFYYLAVLATLTGTYSLVCANGSTGLAAGLAPIIFGASTTSVTSLPANAAALTVYGTGSAYAYAS